MIAPGIVALAFAVGLALGLKAGWEFAIAAMRRLVEKGELTRRRP